MRSYIVYYARVSYIILFTMFHLILFKKIIRSESLRIKYIIGQLTYDSNISILFMVYG